MRSFAIELVTEVIEFLLLLERVHRCRAGGLLLECQMHWLVAAVLLRMLDVLDLNTLSHRTDSFDKFNSPLGQAAATPGRSGLRAGVARQTIVPKLFMPALHELFARPRIATRPATHDR
jgi:hypothetical protein